MPDQGALADNRNYESRDDIGDLLAGTGAAIRLYKENPTPDGYREFCQNWARAESAFQAEFLESRLEERRKSAAILHPSLASIAGLPVRTRIAILAISASAYLIEFVLDICELLRTRRFAS
jgi:hypothetical protein